MKQKKTLKTMLYVLAALIVVTLMINTIQKAEDKISKTAAIVIEKETEDITGIKMTVGTSSLELNKVDDQWVYSLDDSYPIDQEAVEELLSNFNKVKASFMISDVTNYSQYGLKSPIATIEITDEESNVTVLNLGDYSTMDEQRYIENGDGNVYLIEDDLYEIITLDKDDFFKGDSFDEYDSIQSVIISADENFEIIYEEDKEYGYSTKYDYYLKNGANYLALSSTKVKSLISSITGLSLDDYASYYCETVNLSSYNLDNPDATIVINYVDGLKTGSQTIYLSKKNSSAYLRFDGSNIVYYADSDTADNLIGLVYDDIRATEVCYVDYDQVDLITFTLDGEKYELTCKKEKLSLNGNEVDGDTLLDAIDDLTISEFSEDDSDKKEEISFVIEQQNEDYPTVKVQLKQLDSEYCIAVVDGEAIGKVSRDSVVTLKEALNVIILNN